MLKSVNSTFCDGDRDVSTENYGFFRANYGFFFPVERDIFIDLQVGRHLNGLPQRAGHLERNAQPR